MKSFSTKKLYILLQLIILILLVIFSINPENRQTDMHTFLLAVMLFVITFVFVISVTRKLIIDDNGDMIFKGFLNSKIINISNINSAYIVNSLGRYVLIVTDGERTGVCSSLVNNFKDVVNYVSPYASNENSESFNEIDDFAINKKTKLYTFFLVIITAFLIYGNVTSYHIL